jgi:NAD(P)-dependent dehydrogenase (short-subunit alcohol dehydrogenase family)
MNKVMIVTGGSRGIGAAVVRLAATEGYAVCVNYLNNQQAAEELVAAIIAKQGKAIAVQADVAKEEDILRLFEQVDARLGTVTALVNNAGILDRQTRIENIGYERVRRIFATNVLGSFICAREAVRRMSTQLGGKGGAIVNISSTAARLGAPNEYVDYAASKAAINTFTLGLSKEVAEEGIRVNAVSPGLVYSDIHASGGEPNRVERVKDSIPMKRGGTPEEVAEAVLWLLSDKASYTTGSILDVAGGR